MKKFLITSVCCLILIPAIANAEQQDCVIEATVKHTIVEGVKNFIHVHFFNAEPYTKNSKCSLRGEISFNQPKGAMIDNLPEGATVKYRYQESAPEEFRWTMISASI